MTKTFNLILVQIIQVIALLISCVAVGNAQESVSSHIDEITIAFKHRATPVAIKKHLVNLKDIPRSSILPHPYQLVENKSYLITTKTVDLGKPIVTFKVPVKNEDEFTKVRILRRVESELAESGFEWRDCTVSRDVPPQEDLKIGSPEYRDYVKRYEEHYLKNFPDYAARTVACEINGLKAEEYFAVVKQIDPSPVGPFTDLKFNLLNRTGPTQAGNEISYRISFMNVGRKNVGALTIRSSFDSDMRATSYIPSKGTCKMPKTVASPRVICFLGELRVGEAHTLEVRGVPSGFPGSGMPGGELNVGWFIEAIISERSTDPLWTVNQFRFEPLRAK